jgi:hypothetical protein
MSSKPVFVTLIGAAMAMAALCAHAKSGQWHFKVKNSTTTDIVKLQVSTNKKDWGAFDIGKDGIGPDETATLVWDTSTDSDPCEEWIRAKFSDGQYSAPSKQDFCEDLDTPIEFGED